VFAASGVELEIETGIEKGIEAGAGQAGSISLYNAHSTTY
jgi:hypothetical protein